MTDEPLEPVTGDTERDALFHILRCADRVVESELGWEQPTRMWTVYATVEDDGATNMSIRQLPDTETLSPNPADTLAILARHLPDPPADIEPVALTDGPHGYAGVVVMMELFRIRDGRRVACRVTLAADINGQLYGVVRDRGDSEPRLLRDWLAVVPREVPRALRRLAWKGCDVIPAAARRRARREASVQRVPGLVTFSAN